MYYEEIYNQKLLKLWNTPGHVLFGDTFQLDKPGIMTGNIVHNEARNFDAGYAETFFQWILSASTDISTMHNAGSETAKKYDIDFDGRCTAYGPRIQQQLPKLVEMLQGYPDSRRACVMILEAEDQSVAMARHLGQTNCEYPCCMGLTFWLSEPDYQRLNVHVTMRSNNYVTTICIDVYLFTRLLQTVADIMGKQLGMYYHHAINAHILPRDMGRAYKILLASILEHQVSAAGDDNR